MRDKTLVVVDHNVPTSDRDLPNPDPESAAQIAYLAENAKLFGLVSIFDEFDIRQGICHVIGPEQGFALPGVTLVCGDGQHPRRTAHSARWPTASAPPRSSTCWRRRRCVQIEVEEHARAGRRQLAAERHHKDIILAIIGEIGAPAAPAIRWNMPARRSARCRWKAA